MSKATHSKQVSKASVKKVSKLTTSSTAEYFSKNLQQVGFSSPTKAVLTTLKESLDNALDACEEFGILPEIKVSVDKIGEGSMRNTDRIRVRVEDNGPGILPSDIAKVFGEYLASSKFGRGRCSRGQQGIGISAATTWAMQTAARGVLVQTKTAEESKSITCVVDVDLKNNSGIIREKKIVPWNKEHGTCVEFTLDGRIQLNGEAGLLNYLRGNVLLNPHLTITYKIAELPAQTFVRVSQEVPTIPEATAPHPHTMKLGEFRAHARLYGQISLGNWLKQSFSKLNASTVSKIVTEAKLLPTILNKGLHKLSEQEFEAIYSSLQRAKLPAPSTNSVFALGEDALALSLQRLGDLDYFSVVTRPPTIVDFKPVQVEIAIARFRNKGNQDSDEPVQVLRFANRVPLQFDKSACAIVKSIEDVTWRTYGLKQPRGGLPIGSYVFAVSIVSPFIKFKNASKETIDASEELVEELRKGLIKAGQRLSRYLNREHKADELERKTLHLEQFGPILIETLSRMIGISAKRKERVSAGLANLLKTDTSGVKENLRIADESLGNYLKKNRSRLANMFLEEQESLASDKVTKSKIETNEAPESDAKVTTFKDSKSKTLKAMAVKSNPTKVKKKLPLVKSSKTKKR